MKTVSKKDIVISSLQNASNKLDLEFHLNREAKDQLVSSILKKHAIGIIVTDKKGLILETNEISDQLFGYENKELINKHFNVLFPDKKEEPASASFAGFFKEIDKESDIECAALKKDGSTLTIELNADMYHGKNETLLKIFSIRDISENVRLRNLQKTWKLIFDHSIDMIAVAGFDGYFKLLNPAWEKVLGWTEAELLSKPWEDFVHPDDLNNTKEELINLTQGKSVLGFENRYLCKDGSIKYLAWDSYPYIEDQLVVAVARDNTTKNEEKNKLELYKLIFSNATDSIVVTEVGKNGQMPNILFANKAYYDMTRYSPEDIIGQQSGFLNGTESELSDQIRLGDCIQKEIPGKFEIINYKKNGEKFWNSFSIFPVRNERGETINWVSFGRDDTSKRAQSQLLMESENKFRSLVQNSSIGIYIFNDKGLLFVNQKLANLTGYSVNELYNIPQEQWIHPEDYSMFRERIVNRLTGKTQDTFYEFRILTKDGNILIVESRGSRTIIGGEVALIGVLIDITYRVQFEKEKEKLIAELTDSYNELKQFSYITSHNLRGPITNLIGIIDLLNFDSIADETTRLLLRGFKKSTFKLNETLQDLINIIIIKGNLNHNFMRISFSDVFKKTTDENELIINNRNVSFDADFSQAPDCSLIKPYIESVFHNLITNSIKYAKPGKPAHIVIRSAKENNKTILTFSDNGLGIDLKKVKDRIFGLYQKFHINEDSKGIGLFLVKSQIQTMKGSIEVESGLNNGTKFTITFNQ